ncbi:MAG: DUF1295 domain-containing protein [Methyloceanibacter sp.]|uniref:DUF1295 domain-containing protein n=1 Tax=Methyloceanibacter sp. TaxID=1965321 RepID=UPI003565C8CD
MSLTFILWVAALQMAAMSLIMAGGWLLQRRTGNSGFVDAAWTFGLGAVGAASALLVLPGGDGPTARQTIVAALVAAWSVRLGTHIVQRTRTIADDPRYAALMNDWGAEAPRRLFVFLQQQAIASLPLALTIFVAAQNPAPFSRVQDWLGLIVIVAGIAGEGLSDRQLRRFVATRKEGARVCDIGLWSWSRHPNYFFEWMFWLAFPMFAIDFSGSYPWGWLGLVGPALMYGLLVHVSGVPPLELHMVAKHGDAYRAYQQRTSVFFPLPPRNTERSPA